MKKPKIPFRLWPGSWGLRGRTREIAEAEYTLSGLELELRLIEITEDNPLQREIKNIRAQQKYNKISEHEAEQKIVALSVEEGQARDIALLDLELRYKKIDKTEYEKKLADIKEQPWVAMPNISWDPADPTKSFFELDYNNYFVTYLRNNGYDGESDTTVVEKWLTDVCRAVATEFSDTGDSFVATALPTTRRVRKNAKKAEYS